ncbi:MAG: SRPBCC family protein [Gammaproteobacteria bacterium]|jgi:hypothetical protein
MIRVSGSVNINVRPEQVFALVTDVCQCGKLNPRVEVISIVAEPQGPMRQGTVYHNRIVVEGRMTEFTSNVIGFEPNTFLEIRTNTYPAVTTQYRVKSRGEGACLEQQMTSEMTPPEPLSPALPPWLHKIFGKSPHSANDADQKAAFQRQEHLLQQQLQKQLEEWLQVVKSYLENQRGKFLA